MAGAALSPPGHVAALLLGALVACSACSVASPGTEVKEALGRTGRLELAAGEARATLDRVRFADVVVSMDGPRALVVAVVEADGRVALGDAAPALTYVGREAFAMERCPGERWCLAGGTLPALRGVLVGLAAAPRPEGARVIAWQIRVERETASAGEDYEVAEGAGARRLRATYRLSRGGEGWRLEEGR